MRLMQLARKLGVKQKEIVDFLAQNDINIDNKSNEKIEQGHLDFIIDHLPVENTAPTPKQNPTKKTSKHTFKQSEFLEKAKKETQKEEKEPEIINTLAEGEVKNEDNTPEPAISPSGQEEVDDPEIEAVKPEVEVIRAKKIKLDGIKIVGKIELPELVKKPAATPKKKYKGRKTEDRGSQKRKTEPFEEKQKRLKHEELKKKREQQKKIKAKKKKYYETTVKPGIATNHSEKKKKKKKKMPDAKPKKVVHYRNPLRKFWAWLNGEFD